MTTEQAASLKQFPVSCWFVEGPGDEDNVNIHVCVEEKGSTSIQPVEGFIEEKGLYRGTKMAQGGPMKIFNGLHNYANMYRLPQLTHMPGYCIRLSLCLQFSKRQKSL